ncbi:hypothetical protein QJS66_06765 [Kocuria rhizophila]|nr:hypothetical protein QJS66_06765 [Kocuria rhizophila]
MIIILVQLVQLRQLARAQDHAPLTLARLDAAPGHARARPAALFSPTTGGRQPRRRSGHNGQNVRGAPTRAPQVISSCRGNT